MACALCLGMVLPWFGARMRLPKFNGWQSFWDQARGLSHDALSDSHVLIAGLRTLRYAWASSSLSDHALVGRDGWLFYADPASRHSLMRTPPFSAAELQAWQATLQARQERLAAYGGQLIVMIPPDKHTIYADQLPYRLSARPTRLEQLVDHLGRAGIAVVDVREALAKGRAQGEVYYRTDTHWNRRGGYWAFTALAQRLQDTYPSLTIDAPPPPFEAHREGNGDLARMAKLLGSEVHPASTLLGSQSGGPDIGFYPRPGFGDYTGEGTSRAPKGAIPRLLVYRDSFGAYLADPYLADSAQEALYRSTNTIDDDLIDKYRPDVLLYEMVERRTYTVPPPPLPKASQGIVLWEGFDPEEEGHRWLKARAVIKLRNSGCPMALSLDVDGGPLHLELEGRPLGPLVGRTRRVQSRMAIPAADPVKHPWLTLAIVADNTALHRVSDRPEDLRVRAGKLYGVGWATQQAQCR